MTLLNPLSVVILDPLIFQAKTPKSTTKARGFGRGLKAERIIGATDSSGELMFLMKWSVRLVFVMGSDMCDKFSVCNEVN